MDAGVDRRDRRLVLRGWLFGNPEWIGCGDSKKEMIITERSGLSGSSLEVLEGGRLPVPHY